MMNLQPAATLLSARFSGQDGLFTAVTTDSRAIQPGDLFIALRGERFDGHAFVTSAMNQGAAGAIVDEAAMSHYAATWHHLPLIIVPDTRLALGQLATHWRRLHNPHIAAITGSNGKTTVKEMLASILRHALGEAAVLVTQGNLNNDIGVPLTLLRLRPGQSHAVIEMGMNHPGEIAYLTRITQPGVALINNAGAAHLAGLGNVEAVARAKGEIFEGLGAQGIAILNNDDTHVALWQELCREHRQVTYALDSKADVHAQCHVAPDHSDLAITTPDGILQVRLQAPGLHNARNALAACAAAFALGMAPDAIVAGLAEFSGVKGRLQRKPGLHGARLIDDTYNANPASVRAAIAVLASIPGKRILVLGDMGELGDNAPELHRQIGHVAKEAGIDILLALGDLSRESATGFGAHAWHYERIQELLADLENLLSPETTVLVKGSRFMQMERVIQSFEIREVPCC